MVLPVAPSPVGRHLSLSVGGASTPLGRAQKQGLRGG